MTPVVIDRVARVIDPEAWGELLTRKSYYYRRRRAKSVKAAERALSEIRSILMEGEGR